jgi:hypothetical protein
MKIKLVNSRTGRIKSCRKGFAWWILLFGNFYYLYKGMDRTFWKWFLIDALLVFPSLLTWIIIGAIIKGNKFQEEFVDYYLDEGYDLVKEAE